MRRLGPRGTARLARAALVDPSVTPIRIRALGAYRRLKAWSRPFLQGLELRRWKKAAPDLVSSGAAWTQLQVVQGGLEAQPPRVRKSYDEPGAFLNQLRALRRLGELGLRVPAIVEVDWVDRSLVVSHVPGPTTGEAGTAAGRIEDRPLLDAAAADLRAIHRAGILMGEITAESVVAGPGGMPWWISFEHSEDHSELSWESFRLLADSDVDQFNRVFGTDLPTYASLERSLAGPDLGGWYSPAYLGAGLRTGPLWNLGVGWGRWEFLLSRRLPDVAGRRILEIGANNGHDALQMLRAGAKSVVGVEVNPERVAQGRFLKRAIEWSDGIDYDYECQGADMRHIPDLELGSFDMVTAFCCLYYLPEAEMADLVRWLSRVSPVLVVGCNERRDLDRQEPDTYRRASLPFNVELLRDNGFPRLQVIEPPGYDRPLVIGHRA